MIEIAVCHRSWPTRFPIWPNNLFLKFVEISDHWMRLSWLKVWQTACVWKMKRKKFVHWILSLHAAKFYESKVNSFCMGKLLIKINIVQTPLLVKPISKVLSYFRKQHVLSRLFTRNFFLDKKRTNQASQNNSFRPQLTSKWTLLHMCHLLPVSLMSSQFCYARGGQ